MKNPRQSAKRAGPGPDLRVAGRGCHTRWLEQAASRSSGPWQHSTPEGWTITSMNASTPASRNRQGPARRPAPDPASPTSRSRGRAARGRHPDPARGRGATRNSRSPGPRWRKRPGARGDHSPAYAYARVGYHRGLDALRRNGWKGHGPVPWAHLPNQGFLRALYALGRPRDCIGEADEAAGSPVPARLQPARRTTPSSGEAPCVPAQVTLLLSLAWASAEAPIRSSPSSAAPTTGGALTTLASAFGAARPEPRRSRPAAARGRRSGHRRPA